MAKIPKVRLQLHIVHETKRAILVRRSDGEEVWLPRFAAKVGVQLQNKMHVISLSAAMAMHKGFTPKDAAPALPFVDTP